MNYSSRFFLYAPLGLFLSLALGVCIHWWVVASAFSDRLAAWNGHQIVPGVTLQFASRRISGFPFSLDTVFQDFSLRIATPRGPTQWRTEHFAMHALTYGREETIFEAAGRQELRWTGSDGAPHDLTFAVGSLHASAIQDKAGLARFDLDLVGFGSRVMTAQRLQFHIRQNHNDRLDFIASGDVIGVSPYECPAMSGGHSSVKVSGAVTPSNAFLALRAGDQDWVGAIANWRNKNGVALIEEISLTTPEQSVGRLRNALQEAPADRLPGLAELLDAMCGVPRY